MERTGIDRGGSIVIKILFSICGRGGSKGVKNKNIRTFLNAPLIHYSLVDAYLAFNGINKEIEKQTSEEMLMEIFNAGYNLGKKEIRKGIKNLLDID